MPDQWEAQFGDKDRRLSEKKANLRLRIFGPYAGTCEFILSCVEYRLQSEEGYTNAKLCNSIPAIEPLSDVNHRSEFNWEASLECIRGARFGVFIFLEARDARFPEFGPFESIDQYDDDSKMAQELNSSVVLEFGEWITLSPRCDDLLIIYEGKMKKVLGSLIMGRAYSQSIDFRELQTDGKQDTIEKVSAAICGQARKWMSNYDKIL